MTGDPIGVPSIGTSSGTAGSIGIPQILYRIEVTSLPPSRNLVSRFGHMQCLVYVPLCNSWPALGRYSEDL